MYDRDHECAFVRHHSQSLRTGFDGFRRKSFLNRIGENQDLLNRVFFGLSPPSLKSVHPLYFDLEGVSEL